MKVVGYRLADYWECPYCGHVNQSRNGTGSDVSCCGEVGHSTAVESVVPVDEFMETSTLPVPRILPHPTRE